MASWHSSIGHLTRCLNTTILRTFIYWHLLLAFFKTDHKLHKKWEKLSAQLRRLQIQVKQSQSALAFAFIEVIIIVEILIVIIVPSFVNYLETS